MDGGVEDKIDFDGGVAMKRLNAIGSSGAKNKKCLQRPPYSFY